MSRHMLWGGGERLRKEDDQVYSISQNPLLHLSLRRVFKFVRSNGCVFACPRKFTHLVHLLCSFLLRHMDSLILICSAFQNCLRSGTLVGALDCACCNNVLIEKYI